MRASSPLKIARLETSKSRLEPLGGLFSLSIHKHRPVSGRWLLGATSGTAGRT